MSMQQPPARKKMQTGGFIGKRTEKQIDTASGQKTLKKQNENSYFSFWFCHIFHLNIIVLTSVKLNFLLRLKSNFCRLKSNFVGTGVSECPLSIV